MLEVRDERLVGKKIERENDSIRETIASERERARERKEGRERDKDGTESKGGEKEEMS